MMVGRRRAARVKAAARLMASAQRHSCWRWMQLLAAAQWRLLGRVFGAHPAATAFTGARRARAVCAVQLHARRALRVPCVGGWVGPCLGACRHAQSHRR
jgi:hypothetical protein